MGNSVHGLEDRLKNLPDKPGVYLFRDYGGEVLYIGKASSIHSRVRSYFQAREGLTPKLQRMVGQIRDIEYIVTETPVHALKWESDLVKEKRPRYNVRLRDDKHFPYIRVTVQEEWPRIEIARRVGGEGAQYFGPFTDARSVRNTLDTMSRLFPHILCNWPRVQKTRACLYFHIGRCPAPCVSRVGVGQYRQTISQALLFLEGKGQQVLEGLRKEMEAAAERLDFENAAALRDRLWAAQKVIDQQKTVAESPVDRDVIGLARDDSHALVQAFFIRQGKLLGRESFVLEGTQDESESAILGSFLEQFYTAAPRVPQEVVLPATPEEEATIRVWLKEKRGGAVRLTVPSRGQKRRLLVLAMENAAESLEQVRQEWLTSEQRTTAALMELQEHLEMSTTPRRVECYDISNIQGTSAVGSMAVFENGQRKRPEYRRFKIKAVEGADDYAMMREVLRRRFRRSLAATAWRGGASDGAESTRAEEWSQLPDLVVLDGGKGQLNAALDVLGELGLLELPVVALAKEREELFLPGRSEPLMLPRDSQGLYLMQRIRDEAHRFAVTYHRQIRAAQSIRSPLDEVPGIGPRRKRALLHRFGSLKGIKEANVEELAAVPGMTRGLAERLKARL